MNRFGSRLLGAVAPLLVLLALPVLVSPSLAYACGGFFCFTQPVDQSAERVLYVKHANKVTAHIQISYSGDDDKFSWVLPLLKVPEVGVGSDSVFTTLEQATQPRFQLEWKNTSNCAGYSACAFDAAAGGGGNGGGGGGSGVSVLKEELVGPYKTVVIQGNSGAELMEWLNTHGYVQPPETAPLLDVYAKQSYVFLALQLQKDQSAGDITPIVVTLDEVAPCLPIRLTKLAVKPDMPIVTWTLGAARAVPKNYLHVTLNEATLDWLQPGANYKTVVSKAVDQASGHAFTTEYAQPASKFPTKFANPKWDTKKLETLKDPGAFLNAMLGQGLPRNTQMQALIRTYIPKPAKYEKVEDNQFYNCIQVTDNASGVCKEYRDAVLAQGFDPVAFAKALQDKVVTPLVTVQKHLDASKYLTRMYTTLSADEMDKDPIFAFNPSLPDVSNLHKATALPICKPGSKQAVQAKLTFESGQTLLVDLPKNLNQCRWRGGPAGATFGKGDAAIVAAGGQPAKSVEVMDETGDPINIDPRLAEKVDAALNLATVGKPSLSAEFLATLPVSTWDSTKTTVDPLPIDGKNPTTPDGNTASTDGGGCVAAPVSGGSTGPALMLLLVMGWLVRRRVGTVEV